MCSVASNLALKRIATTFGCNSCQMMKFTTVIGVAPKVSPKSSDGCGKDISKATPDEKRRTLHVLWKNGIKGSFPYVWLRDNCPAEHSYILTDNAKTRKMLFKDLDIHVKPTKIESNSDGVRITWPGELDSFYSSEWLSDRNLKNPETHKMRKLVDLNKKKRPWNAKCIRENMRPFQWDRLFDSDSELYDALQFLNEYGLLLIDGVPCKKGQVAKFGKELGFTKQTHYGDTFDVISNHDPSNMAYTSKELGLHMDLPYLIGMPEIQALHVIQAAELGHGGQNTFVDIMWVAEQMRKEEPETHAILRKTPLEYSDECIEDGKAYKMIYRHPVFNYDSDNNFKHMVWSNQMRSWYYNTTSSEEVIDVYRAMASFREFYSRPANVFEILLKAGQMIVFDNLRVMHGRSAYEDSADPNSPPRQLEGMYYTWDAVRSRMRVLHAALKLRPEIFTV